MIKMVYKQETYDYKYAGGQPYDIRTEVVLKDDANLKEAIAAYLDFLKIATYHINKENIQDAIDDYFL